MKDISMAEVVRRYRGTTNALGHLATAGSRRRYEYAEEDMQALDNPYVRDLGAIMCSKAWRRQEGKNQVACSDNAPIHLRNRSTHVAEVMSCATRLADHLGLNVHLAAAGAAGHDIGHVPFGHQGEAYLQERIGTSFCHEVMGVVVMQKIERKGRGVNLTHATLEAMHMHSGDNMSQGMSPEAGIVRIADKVAYLFADFNDFKRLGHRYGTELAELMEWFGDNQRGRSSRTMMAVCEESAQAGCVRFEESEAALNFKRLRKLMYNEYYKIVEQNVAPRLDPIWDLLERSELIPPALGISLLTDVEVSRILREGRLVNSGHLRDTGLGEILDLVPREQLFEIDITSLDLDW